MLHHIEIYVSNLTKTKEFWSWLLLELNYERDQDWDNGFSYKYGETYLVFVQTKEKYLDEPYHRCRVGLNHLAFHARSNKHVDELTTKLSANGVRLLYQDKYPFSGGNEHYAVYFEDPDRIKVEIVAPR
ncbi:MAG: VOC family protein [Bacillota bacterium]